MSSDTAKVRQLVRQQAAMASFGSFALRQNDLLEVLTEAARACAQGLSVPYSKVCRYRPEEDDLLIEAGYGWQPGVIGNVVSRADESSPQGRAFRTGQPSICNDLLGDSAYDLPPFYAQHGIVSTLAVIIKGEGATFGILEVDSDQPHQYDSHEIDFLTGFANVLGEAVATSSRLEILKATLAHMKALVEEKDRLIDQKNILAQELQHRVRNNLQLVWSMVNQQREETTDQASIRGLKRIARHISTLTQVYDHLLGSGMARTTDFGDYVQSLCNSLVALQETPNDAITLTCDSEALALDLDVVTGLGIVVAELVSNSYDHAFSVTGGNIVVSVRRSADEEAHNLATLTISDDGPGFQPSPTSKRRGVGLVRRLVEQVGGTVTLDTTKGTVWKVKLPTTTGIAPDGTTEAVPSRGPPPKQERLSAHPSPAPWCGFGDQS